MSDQNDGECTFCMERVSNRLARIIRTHSPTRLLGVCSMLAQTAGNRRADFPLPLG
jgi:hypothetical protein